MPLIIMLLSIHVDTNHHGPGKAKGRTRGTWRFRLKRRG